MLTILLRSARQSSFSSAAARRHGSRVLCQTRTLSLPLSSSLLSNVPRRFLSAETSDSSSDDEEQDDVVVVFADEKPLLMSSTSAAAAPAASPALSSSVGSSPPYRGKLYDDLPITFADISRAEVAIRGGVKRTYCEHSPFISELVGANVYFKGEYKQFTGSFKERGARNAILSLMRRYKQDLRGVIAASAGNHAQALAYHGMLLGVPATVVMPIVAPLAKVDKCRKFGARVIIKGEHIGESKEYAETLVASEGLNYVNGYDDPPILAGAGTIGSEMIDDIPDVDVVVVPIGGAGLIAGVSCAIKTLKPDCQVIGVEPEFCASYTAALRAGKPVPAAFTPTLADGLAVPVVGSHAFEVARHYVDECVTVTEKEIALAVLRLLENEKIVVEGGGAAGLAALLPGGTLDRADMKGKNIVVPLCGGNIDTTVLGRVIDRGLAADKRLVNFYATVSDRPGGISKMTAILSEEGASIKDIYHERAWLHTTVDQVQVKCVVEIQGADHGKRVHQALLNKGYPVQWNVVF